MRPVRALVLAVIAVAASASAQTTPSSPTADPGAIAALRAKSAAASAGDRAEAGKLFSSAFKLWQAGDFNSAEVGFREGLKLDPANGPANFYYADILQRKGDPSAAGYLARAAALSPDTPEGLKARAAMEQAATETQSRIAAADAAKAQTAKMVEALKGKWFLKVKSAPWGASVSLDPSEDGTIKLSRWALGYGPVSGSFHGASVEMHFKYCSFGCDHADFFGSLVSPTRMEGTTNHGKAFYADKTSD
jgi:tetratricopeptide (TPR) repeat protein